MLDIKITKTTAPKAKPTDENKLGFGKIFTDHMFIMDYSEEEATRILSEDEVTAIADVKMGDATATAWGCDLTYDYVKINADYRS